MRSLRSKEELSELCMRCGKCCMSMCFEFDVAPQDESDVVRWLELHGLQVDFYEKNGILRRFITIQQRCEALIQEDDRFRCNIYETRPRNCRECDGTIDGPEGVPDCLWRRDNEWNESLPPEFNLLSKNDRAQEVFVICNSMYEMMDQCSESMLQIVKKNGRRVACQRGCSACCNHYIPATFAEAVTIALWLQQSGGENVLNCFRERLQQREVILGAELNILNEFAMQPDSPPAEGPDFDNLRQAGKCYRLHNLFCPFNASDGSCMIYPVRPTPCRAYYVADTSEYCQMSSSQPPAIITHPTHTQTIRIVQEVLLNISAGYGYYGRKSLPEAVQDALLWLSSGSSQSME